MPQNRKGKGRSVKPLAVPTLDNRPRYKTPDPVQLPTPGPTPSARLPTIFKKRLGGTLSESKEEEKEEEASSSSEEESFGPWVAKGNPVGFLDSDDEELIDGWGREQRVEKFNSMNLREWKTVGLFLLSYFVRFIGGEEAPEGTDFDMVLAILGEDGSIEFEGRDDLSKGADHILNGRSEWMDRQDATEDKEDQWEKEVASLQEQIRVLRDTEGVSNQERKQHLDLKLSYNYLVNMQAEREELAGNQLQICKRNWKEWAEKEAGERSRKMLVSERKKWQAKGKALPVETVSVPTQLDHVVEEIKKVQVEVAVQTEAEIEEKGARDKEDVVMAEQIKGKGDCDSWGPLPETHGRYYTGYRSTWGYGGTLAPGRYPETGESHQLRCSVFGQDSFCWESPKDEGTVAPN